MRPLRILPAGLPNLRALERRNGLAARPHLSRSASTPAVPPARGAKRARVGLVPGCVQGEFFPPVNPGAVRVLAAEGGEVVAPQDHPCCGARLVPAGQEAPAIVLARKT